MAGDGDGDDDELPSVDHGPLNEGPWEKFYLQIGMNNQGGIMTGN